MPDADPSTTAASAEPDFGSVVMNAHSPRDPGTGTVIESRRCTRAKASGFVRHVAIDVSQTKLAGAFRAGQSFGVIPDGAGADGKPHKVRLYSIASPSAGEDGAGNVLATTVKRTLDEHWDDHRLFCGRASNWLCDLQVGDEIRMTGPVGKRFLLPAEPARHRYLFLATGTGIAPFRGMVMELLAADPNADITLIVGVPYATELMYDEQLRALEARHRGFRYLTAISRHEQEDGGGPMYLDGRMSRHADAFRELLADQRTLVYLCGLAGMEIGVYLRLAELVGSEGLSGYLHAASGESGDLRDLGQWDAATIRKQVRPGPRLMAEVY